MIADQSAPSLVLLDNVYQAWWLDPFLATLSFAFFVNLYWYHERCLGLSSDSDFFATVRADWGPLFNSLVAYWIGVSLWVLVVPPAAPFIPDGVPRDVSTAGYLFAEVTSGIVFYDFVFFFVHWSMHEIPLLRRWHCRHHDQSQGESTLESRDTLRHSLMDGALQVLVNILVQRRTPWGLVKSRLGRALHNFVVVWMLVESHTATPTLYFWRRWCKGVREHKIHHEGARGRPQRYQQFFSYLDDARNHKKANQFVLRGPHRPDKFGKQ